MPLRRPVRSKFVHEALIEAVSYFIVTLFTSIAELIVTEVWIRVKKWHKKRTKAKRRAGR